MSIKIGVLAIVAGFAGAVLFSQSSFGGQALRVVGILGLIALTARMYSRGFTPLQRVIR